MRPCHRCARRRGCGSVALESFGGTLEVLPMGLALGAGVALMRFHTGMIRTLLVCAAIGLVARLA